MTHYYNSKNKQKTIYVNKKLNNKGKWIGLFKKNKNHLNAQIWSNQFIEQHRIEFFVNLITYKHQHKRKNIKGSLLESYVGSKTHDPSF